jgi:hypothetical protein
LGNAPQRHPKNSNGRNGPVAPFDPRDFPSGNLCAGPEINQLLTHLLHTFCMRLWTYAIEADESDSERTGFVWAPSAQAALATVGHPDASVYQLPDDASCGTEGVLNPDADPQKRGI